ncbi:hypothetical protein KRP22_011417 [Phytophthora ramorum]|nr:hypothetical protein KRP22_10619 [Phytophthora ramorum]
MGRVLTSYSPADLAWKNVCLEVDRQTPLEIKEVAEKKLQKAIQVNFIDPQENVALATKVFTTIMSKTMNPGANPGNPRQVFPGLEPALGGRLRRSVQR